MRWAYFTADTESPNMTASARHIGGFISFIGKSVFSHEVTIAAVAL